MSSVYLVCQYYKFQKKSDTEILRSIVPSIFKKRASKKDKDIPYNYKKRITKYIKDNKIFGSFD